MKRAMRRPFRRVSRHSAVFFGCVVAVALAFAGINGCLMTYDPDGVELANTDTTPSMSIVSPTPNQMFTDCTGHSFAVCLRVEIDLRNVRLVPKWGQANVAGEGYLYVTVAPTDNPEQNIIIANPGDEGIVETNFTIDLGNLPDGAWTLRVEVRNNDRTPYELGPDGQLDLPDDPTPDDIATIGPISVDFRKSS